MIDSFSHVCSLLLDRISALRSHQRFPILETLCGHQSEPAWLTTWLSQFRTLPNRQSGLFFFQLLQGFSHGFACLARAIYLSFSTCTWWNAFNAVWLLCIRHLATHSIPIPTSRCLAQMDQWGALGPHPGWWLLDNTFFWGRHSVENGWGDLSDAWAIPVLLDIARYYYIVLVTFKLYQIISNYHIDTRDACLRQCIPPRSGRKQPINGR